MRDAIVVGAGIVGATVACALRKQGRDVLLLDDGRPMSGTKPSGGHMKPSWFSGMPKSEYEPAMELLDQIWGILPEEFRVRPATKPRSGRGQPAGINATVYRIDTDQVLRADKTIETVTGIQNPGNWPVVATKEGREEQCRLLVVAAGVWCEEIMPGSAIGLQRKKGVSFRFRGKLDQPFIKPWAPYKQVVAHQQSEDEIWVGDGSAILDKNWTDARTMKCLGRCRTSIDAGGTKQPTETRIGLRPYYKTGSDPCLIKRIGHRTWVVTGAGKSGTIAAGWAARRIIDASE